MRVSRRVPQPAAKAEGFDGHFLLTAERVHGQTLYSSRMLPGQRYASNS